MFNNVLKIPWNSEEPTRFQLLLFISKLLLTFQRSQVKLQLKFEVQSLQFVVHRPEGCTLYVWHSTYENSFINIKTWGPLYSNTRPTVFAEWCCSEMFIERVPWKEGSMPLLKLLLCRPIRCLTHSWAKKQKPAKNSIKKFVKLTDYTYARNNVTNFECNTHPFSKKGKPESCFKKFVKSQ